MKKKLPLTAAAIVTAGVALLAPSAAHADGAAVDTGGVTTVTVVDQNGAPRVGVTVSVSQTDDKSVRTGNEIVEQARILDSRAGNGERAQLLRDQAALNAAHGVRTTPSHRADDTVLYLAVTDENGVVTIPSSGHLSPAIRVYAGVGTTATASITNRSYLDLAQGGIAFAQTVSTDRPTLTVETVPLTMPKAMLADIDTQLVLTVP